MNTSFLKIFICVLVLFICSCAKVPYQDKIEAYPAILVEEKPKSDPLGDLIKQLEQEAEKSIELSVDSEETATQGVIDKENSFEISNEITRVDLIEVHVLSTKITVFQYDGNEALNKNYPAGTAAPKHVFRIGNNFGKIGKIHMIRFNPYWNPPLSIRREHFQKTGKWLKKRVPPGEDNPLGDFKLFIEYDGINSALGIHHTNNPSSVGKRVSHGCVRTARDDMREIIRIILLQNWLNADEIFKRAAENPNATFDIKLVNKPAVVYLKD